jgi:DNA helicase-2/ATP-dependent DNA helicase PcrA
VLARTNAELVPIAAVALELGLAVQVESDELLLDDAEIGMALATADVSRPLLVALRDAATQAGLAARLTTSLLAWAAGYESLETLRDAYAARGAVRRGLAQTEASPDAPPLTLATIHATKGLEWDHVACIGHDEGVFPSARTIAEALDPARALEEERRLAYVAWTRARRTLTLVYDPGAPSTFILEAFDRDEVA